MVIFLNPYCSYGHGMARWERIESELTSKAGSFILEAIQSPESLPARVSMFMQSGETEFIAAGGDGTVNLLLNAILSAHECSNGVFFGAVGLGSSNDYHKPLDQREFVGQVPVRINRQRAAACDVICVRYLDSENQRQTRFCLNNASLGVTAEANALFNRQPGFIRGLRKVSVNAAIAATAVKTIFLYRNIACRLSVDGGNEEEFMVTNLGIVKNPHFAGSLRYETTVQPDDGRLGVHLCEKMSRGQAIVALSRLSQGKFRGYPKTRTWSVRRLRIESEQSFAVELDGEVITTRAAEFSVMQKALRCGQ